MTNRFTQKVQAQGQDKTTNVVNLPASADLPEWFETKKNGDKKIITYNLAWHVLARYPTAYDSLGLIIFDKKSGVWVSGTESVNMFINNVVSNEFLKAQRTNRLVNEVVGSIEAITVQRSANQVVDKPIVGKLSLANGTYDMKTGVFEKNVYHPENYCRVQHPIQYDPMATAPAFVRFLDYIAENDEEKKQFILEMMGSAFWTSLDETFLQRIVFMYGSGGSGKSTLIKLIREMIGRRGTTDLGVAAMTKINGFNLDRVYNKNVIIDADTDVDRITDTSILRKLSAGDVAFMDVKGKEGRELASYALMLITTNKLIQILDKEGEFRRRGLVLTLKAKVTTSVARKNHFDFNSDIHPEIPGIFNMAMSAFRAAMDRCEFTISEEMQETTTRWLDSNNKAIMFIQETLDEGQLIEKVDGVIQKNELYQRYRIWEKENGSYKPLMKKEFYRRIEAMGYRETRVSGIKYYDTNKLENLSNDGITQKYKTPFVGNRQYAYIGLTNAANSSFSVASAENK